VGVVVIEGAAETVVVSKEAIITKIIKTEKVFFIIDFPHEINPLERPPCSHRPNKNANLQYHYKQNQSKLTDQKVTVA
jgi:hypothetical protein